MLFNSYILNGQKVEIYLVSHDDALKTQAVIEFWKLFFLEEMNFNFNDLLFSKLTNYRVHKAYLFAAFYDQKCIGTLQASHQNLCELEFEYVSLDINQPVIEVSKLIIDKSYRKTFLKLLLMTTCQQYAIEKHAAYFICINCTERLIDFYETIGLKKVLDKVFIHPTLNNECYLMYCSSAEFELICADFNLLISGQRRVNSIKSLRYLFPKNT